MRRPDFPFVSHVVPRFTLAVAALLPAVSCNFATAQQTEPAGPLQTVEVKAPDPSRQRRDDPIGRIVVGRDALQRFGDASLGDVLKRQPGLSVSGNEIRMRGLGAGYTQILIDGEPAPDGFAVAGLAPELIERIEIQRSAQADASAQAVAGSVNIVLHKASGPARRIVKLGAGGGTGERRRDASLQWTGRRDAVAYGLTAIVDAQRRNDTPTVDERTADAGVLAVRRFDGGEGERTRKFSLAPRADLKLDDGTLAWQSLFDKAHLAWYGDQHENTLLGPATASPDNDWQGFADTWLAKSDVAWSQRLGAGRWTLKAGVEANGRVVDYRFHGTGPAAPARFELVDSGAFERRASASGKYVVPLAAGHDVAVGWDGALTRRDERRRQHSDAADLDQSYQARLARLAWFVQDEWTLSPRLQGYAGLRWEGLDTSTEGRDVADTTMRSRVWSPIAQAVWKLPDATRTQLRVALARTYKAPQPRDLMLRRYTVNNDNGPAAPDYQGNPLLRPERAWGLDAALESSFGREGTASIAYHARHIRDVTLLRIWQEGRTWISSPANGGNAREHGIEADTRLPLTPAFELRANLARNWSRVEGLAGPDNRLSSQAPLTANLAMDVRPAKDVSAGANFHLVGGSRARAAPALTVVTGIQRELEAYASWRAARGQWRLTLTDLLHQGRHSARVYDDGTTASARWIATPRHPRLQLHYETGL
jgi:outer membrane receptor for ferrienterochelin and colicins